MEQIRETRGEKKRESRDRVALRRTVERMIEEAGTIIPCDCVARNGTLATPGEGTRGRDEVWLLLMRRTGCVENPLEVSVRRQDIVLDLPLTG